MLTKSSINGNIHSIKIRVLVLQQIIRRSFLKHRPVGERYDMVRAHYGGEPMSDDYYGDASLKLLYRFFDKRFRLVV